jgi:hypothetical protein
LFSNGNTLDASFCSRSSGMVQTARASPTTGTGEGLGMALMASPL